MNSKPLFKTNVSNLVIWIFGGLSMIAPYFAHAQDDLQTGLVACYSFSGNANDASGNNNNGTLNGPTLTADRLGNANSAYQFDGVSNYISLPINIFANNNYTYSVWANATAIPSYGTVGNVLSIGRNNGYHQVVNLANVYASVGSIGWDAGAFNIGTPSTISAQTSELPTAGQWYHLVSTRDDNYLKLYVNGVLITTSSTFGTKPDYSTTVYGNIGMRCNYVQPFYGLIDDISIYNRALTASEVMDLFLIGSPCSTIVDAHADDVAMCGHGQFTLTASGGTSYHWYDSPSGGTLLSTNNPFVTPSIAVTTSYYVTAIVGGVESSRIKVNAIVYPQPAVVCNFPATYLVGHSPTFEANISAGTAPFTYNWSFGDKNTLITQVDSTTHLYAVEGNYQVQVNVIDANNCNVSCSNPIQIKLPPVDLMNGLVGCYSFSNNTNDASGFLNNGTNHGAIPAADRFGTAKSAYQFDGSSSYISLPADAFRNNNYTYSVWANATAIPSEGNVGNVISIGLNNGHHQVIDLSNVYASVGSIGWGAGAFNIGNPETISAQAPSLPSTGQWYHVTSTRDDNFIKLYINGVLIASSNTSGTIPDYSDTVYGNIGIRCNLIQPFFGLIDDVAIYKRAIYSNEVQQLYSQGLPCPVVVRVTANDVFQCAGTTAVLTASGGVQYNWYDSPTAGNLLFVGNPFQTPILSQTTSYYVTARIGTNVSDRVKVDVIIFPLPEVVCNFPEEINLGESAHLQANVQLGTPPFTYQWSFGDSIYTNSQNNFIDHTYINNQSYAIKLNISDVNGCAASCMSTIKVDFKPFIPNVLTINHDDELNNTLTLFSTTKNGYVKYSGDDPFILKIFDRWGKEIFHTEDPIQGWNGENVSAGVYFWRIISGKDDWKGWVEIIH